MSSVIYFRLNAGTEMEPVHFTGHQLRLLDLKRAIVEKKKLATGLDFELDVRDAEVASKRKHLKKNKKCHDMTCGFKTLRSLSLLAYVGDDSFVPRNSSVVAKRRPLSGAGPGLIARLGSSKPASAHAGYASPASIAVPIHISSLWEMTIR